jgi:hypothetical protein
MKHGLLAAIVPFDGYARPIRFSDGATVRLIVSPAHAVANLKESGLVAGHFSCFIPQTVAFIEDYGGMGPLLDY